MTLKRRPLGGLNAGDHFFFPQEVEAHATQDHVLDCYDYDRDTGERVAIYTSPDGLHGLPTIFVTVLQDVDDALTDL